MATAPALQAELGPSDLPLALLPVRLETRFFRVENAMEVRIRVYPDKVHIDSHETLLTASERQWGVHFWEQCWRAGSDAERQAHAWRQLAERYGAPRAGWIAHQLRPTNPDQQPTTPIAADRPLSPAPAFRDPPTAPAGDDTSWRRAPQAQLLPDRWIAVAYHNGQPALVATGKDIVLPLAAGPDPSPDVPTAQTADDQLAIDAGMRWMVDFDVAEARGMALRMTLTPTQVLAGIQALLVFGVRGALPADEGAAQFAALLDAHHYTDGLEFLRFGAPTNNTAELRSAYSSSDAADQRSYVSEVGSGAAAAAQRGSNARELGAALGLASAAVPDVLGRVPGAGDGHALDAAAMNTALWPVSWGYYLSNLIGFDGTGFSVELLAWARRHFIDYVRGAGPLPAIRCGRQPYGLLPVTSLDLWQPPAGEEIAHAPLAWLRTPLLRLRDNIWRGALREVPRLGSPADPHEALSQVMRTEALSSRYAVRSMMGRHYVQHLRAFMVEDLVQNGWISTQDAAAAGLLQRMNFAWRPRLARSAYGDLNFLLKAPLVQAGEVSAARGLEPNYIAALLAETTVDDIAAKHAQDSAGGTLLHALLRHALLLEYAGAAAGILSTTGTPLSTLLRDAELVDLVGGAPPTLTWRRQLDQRVAPITGDKTIRQYLQSAAGLQDRASASLRETRAALERLRERDSEKLQYLMQTTLDLASHRLDAWATSYATQRLAAMRAAKPEGLMVGGYGWVENLQSRGLGLPVEALPPNEPGPLFAPRDDTGFIHAPSTAQATVAALLRNAHLGVDGAAEADGPLAVDLSSRRLRTARWLLDGVRRGQPLGALLGYRFERRLHDDNLDVEIARFRRIAPLVADKREATNLPAESIAAANVVDGLRLAQWWEANRASVRVGAKLGAALNELSETIDAVGDALTAESAYQVVRGNVTRVASSLSAITQGDGAIPELDVARTPRTGTLLTHRVLLLFAGAAPATTGWPAATTSPRSRTERMLNAWAARVIGDARKIRCIVERLSDDAAGGDTVQQTIELPLSELKLTPLDVVYSVDVSARPGQASALEQRLLYHVRARQGGVGDAARLRIRAARPAGAAAGALFLADAIAQARAVRRLLAGARPLDAADLDLPERASSGTLDLAGIEARVKKAESDLRQLRNAAKTALDGGEAATAPMLRELILRCDSFGLAGAIPANAAGDEANARAALRRQLGLLSATLNSRVLQCAALAAQRPASDALDDTRALRRHLADRLAITFGADYAALPSFTCGHTPELAAALGDSTALQGGDPLAVATWFERCKRVREPLARLAATLTGAEVLDTGVRPLLRVAQLPYLAGARWVALPAADAKAIPPSRLSLVIQSAATLTPATLTAGPLAGLLIDEWVETVPNARETTAITFQTDPPNACAPQAVLLAVPPVPGKAWTGETLARVLFETLEWAKLRAVDAEALGELGHYLPALHLGFNVAGDAVSTDFKPLS